MSAKILTFLPRRPSLVRVWRTSGQPGAPLTSTWLSPDTAITSAGGVIR